jgi:hypothetical protein
MGRYPIHFHLSGNVDGAVVSKNTIRASNQRCVVAHGTHNLTISDNVAFDTMGHCYMTEDGGEIDNVFVRNLGALTRAATRVVRQGETDISSPSTFWCSNPVNEWVGNVAAGCEANGFWFELQESVRSPTSLMPLSAGMNPRRMPLKLFRDNVSHSNQNHGLRTYPIGYLPSRQAIFDNTRSYKNRQDGIFFHNSENLSVTGGVLADNRIQADFDRADNIIIDGTAVIGVTTRYQEIVDTQIGTPFHDDIVVGIELHGFVRDPSLPGATIRNVRFSGFSGSQSNHTALIQFDDEKWSGNFDYWTTVEGVQIDDDEISPLHFYFLKAALNGIRNVYLTDLDSSMKPKGSSASGTSSVVSDTLEMTTFLETSRCESFPDRGFLYCIDTCLRTVTFATSPAETDAFVLRLSARSDPNLFFDYPGRYNYESDDGELLEMSNTEIRKFRYFSASIPSGDYVASFLDSNLEESWPTFVETTVESPQCLGSLAVDGVELHIPDVPNAQCSELIRNGDMELSTTSFPHWLHFDIGVTILPGEGIDGSNAIASNPDRNRVSGYIGQYLDVRCLEEGITYEVQAWVRLERDGVAFACNGSDCPLVRLRSRAPSDASGLVFSETVTTVATSFVRPLNENGWNLLQSTFTVDSPLASATSVSLVVERGVNNAQMFLDNVKLTRVEKDCAELVFNGDFSEGTSAFWQKDGGGADLEMLSIQGNPALRMVSRSSDSSSMVQNIQTRCMMKGERYTATAKMRLLDSDGTQFVCDTTERSGRNACPRMRLRSFVDVGLPTQDGANHYGGSIAETDHGVTTDGWHVMSGIFEATEYDQRGENSVLSFSGAWRRRDLVVDDVSISPLPMDCTELILNGDAEYGETPSFWTHISGAVGTTIEVVNVGSGSNVFKVSNRPIVGEGMSQTVDSRCLHQGSMWKLTARMKLVSRSSGNPVSCDPSDNRVDFACPPILVAGFQAGERVEDERYYTSRTSWVADAFNDYEVEFAVSDVLAASNVVVIAIRTYNLDWEVLVDDISVTPVF